MNMNHSGRLIPAAKQLLCEQLKIRLPPSGCLKAQNQSVHLSLILNERLVAETITAFTTIGAFQLELFKLANRKGVKILPPEFCLR